MSTQHMEEGLNLNLAKQATKLQKKQPADQELEQIFGKNVYRLYYDLDTGEQIYPTRKDPKLKFNVPFTQELRDDIEERLNQFDFQVVDFETNKAQNTRNKQVTKISKVLAKTDIGLLTKYTDYLENMTRNVQGKFYAVISRHVHDIAMMGSHDNFSTCENLSDYNDIRDTMLNPKWAERGENPHGDGAGERAYHMMKDGHLIFYMVKEGDWNIQNPVARFAEGAYCTDRATIYGDYSSKFEGFFRKWLKHFDLNVRKVKNLVADEDFFKKDTKELVQIYDDLVVRGHASANGMRSGEFLRGLIKYKRFEVIDLGISGAHSDYQERGVRSLCADIVGISPKILDLFPSELKEKIMSTVNKQVDTYYKYVSSMRKRLDAALNNPDTLIQKFGAIMDIFDRLDDYRILSVFGFDSQGLWEINAKNHGGDVPFLDVAKAYGSDKANFVYQQVPEILQYLNGAKRGELLSSLKNAVARFKQGQVQALAEQINRMRGLSSIKENNGTMMEDAEEMDGKVAAGAIPLCLKTKRVLVGLRSELCSSSGTWNAFGGSVDPGENVQQAVKREMQEELGYTGSMKLVAGFVFKFMNMTYYNHFAIVPAEFQPRLNWEHDEARWLTLEELMTLPNKHYGLMGFIRGSQAEFKKYLGNETVGTNQ